MHNLYFLFLGVLHGDTATNDIFHRFRNIFNRDHLAENIQVEGFFNIITIAKEYIYSLLKIVPLNFFFSICSWGYAKM